jgi:hypothetical protein
MAWRKFHQEWASVRRVACNSTPAAGLNVQTERQAHGTIAPISIGFLRSFVAMPAARAGQQSMLAGRSRDRMILLTFAACLPRRFRFTLDRHNFATELSPSSPETRYRPAAGANHASESGRQWKKGRMEVAGRRLPKSWASAGAFSLLTPASKLAQY